MSCPKVLVLKRRWANGRIGIIQSVGKYFYRETVQKHSPCFKKMDRVGLITVNMRFLEEKMQNLFLFKTHIYFV